MTEEQLDMLLGSRVGRQLVRNRLPGGVMGEFRVLEKLSSLGFDVSASRLNSRESGLRITRPGGTTLHVEIKSGADGRPTFWVSRRPDPNADAIWVFVRGDGLAAIFTAAEITALWDANPHNAGVHEGTARTRSGRLRVGDVRWHQFPQEAMEAWGKFETCVAVR